jgi:hypothetical protein
MDKAPSGALPRKANMAIPTQIIDTAGNVEVADAQSLSYDAMLNTPIRRGSQPTVCTGTGAPTFSAPQGSMYLRIDGGVNTRVYINTNGTTGWTPLTNAA